MGLFGFGKKEKDKMKDGLEKTRTGFWGNILNTLTGSKIDEGIHNVAPEARAGLFEAVFHLIFFFFAKSKEAHWFSPLFCCFYP